MKHLMTLLMMLTSALATPAYSEETPLKALFFTPKQRQAMDRARRGDPTLGLAPIEDRDSVIGGFVQRSDGHTAVWVDGAIRFDLLGDAIKRLKPADVGSAANTITVINNDVTITPAKISAKSNAVKPRKKTTPEKTAKSAKAESAIRNKRKVADKE